MTISSGTAYMLFYSANLAFIVTHIYGWLLKRFYRPKAYVEHFDELFPAQRSVGVIYLLQIFELPYLLQIGDPKALIYVNAFALLFFPIQMLLMCKNYFFPSKKHTYREYLIFLPAAVILLPLLLQAVGLIELPAGYRVWTFAIVTSAFAVYLLLSVSMAVKIGRTVRQVNEASYADSEDFPVRFARLIQWVPTIVCVLLLMNFLFDSAWVKFVRDIIFIFASIWFCILTLNPWRKVFTPDEQEIIEQIKHPNASAFYLSDNRSDELCRRLEKLLGKDLIFTEPHITIDILVQRLGTNSKYIAEVIKRSGYQSFYDMICQHRVRHAISLIHQRPDEKLQSIAAECGFSSPASMAKAFKQQGKNAPSTFRKNE